MLSILNTMTGWRRLRRGLALTQAEVAKATGISRTALSHIERGRSTPSSQTEESLRRALDPFANTVRLIHPRSPQKAAETLRDIASGQGLRYALTLDVAAWLLTGYQTPSAAWAYVRPLEAWTEEVLATGASRASPTERANLLLLRAPEEALGGTEVRGFRLVPLPRIVADGARLGGRHALDAARLYLEFPEARRPGLRLDPDAVVKAWEETGPWK